MHTAPLARARYVLLALEFARKIDSTQYDRDDRPWREYALTWEQRQRVGEARSNWSRSLNRCMEAAMR